MTTNRIPDEPGRYRYVCLLRLPEVISRVGLSRSELYRRIAADPPTFPAPIKLGERASAWNAAEVDSWITDRIAARDAKAAA